VGVAAAFRRNLLTKSAARVRLDGAGTVTVQTDMTDIGTGSYTIIAQTAAEMMGVPLHRVVVRLARISQCARRARFTSGGRFHPASCRFELVADERSGGATRRTEAS
jgi:CO/xanthine dehydrogenase Mo-binding subunit